MRISKTMSCLNWVLPFLNTSLLYIEFNTSSNTFIESKACSNYVDVYDSINDESSTPFSSSLPFRYSRSRLFLGNDTGIQPDIISSTPDYWKKLAPQDQFIDMIGDNCPTLTRDFLLSSRMYDGITPNGTHLILHPTNSECTSCDPLERSPTFGTYSCGSECSGYVINDNGQIFIEVRGDLLKIYYTSFYSCGVFGVIESSATISQPCYGQCADKTPIAQEYGFFSPNLAIYIEFLILIASIVAAWRYLIRFRNTNRLRDNSDKSVSVEADVSFNTGTWIVIYLIFGTFISVVTVIIAQGINYLGNLFFTTLPLVVILPLFIFQLADTFSSYTNSFSSRLSVLAYMLLALLPVWGFITLDHPFLLNGRIEAIFSNSQAASVLFFGCFPFGVESLINYTLIRREIITSYHLKYASGFIYAVFATNVLLFTVIALRNWSFYVAIFDSIVSVIGFLMMFIGEGDVEKGAGAMGSLVASIAWTIALFSQPLLSFNFSAIVHWIIMFGLLTYTNIKKNHSLQTRNVNTYLSVSAAARITYIVTFDFLFFSGILQSLVIGGVSFGVLYIVQFNSNA